MLQIFLFVMLLGSSSFAHFTPLQEKALHQVLDWIHDPRLGNGQPPKLKDFRQPTLPIRYHKLVGAAPFRNHPDAIFNSSEEFWLSLSAFAQMQGRPISLLEVKFNKPSPQLLEHLQEEVMQTVLGWIRIHQRFPQSTDFGQDPDDIPLVYERVTSTGSYDHGKVRTGIYPSSLAFWQTLFSRVAADKDLSRLTSGVRFRHQLLEHDVTPVEANARVLAWVKAHPGEVPLRRHFGMGKGMIPLHYARLMGQGIFAPGRVNAAKAYFSGGQEFWCQFKSYAAEQGVTFQLLDIVFRGALLQSTREILQGEALERVSDWININYRLPLRLDYGFKPGQIPVDYRRLTGLDAYAPGTRYHRAAIFSSPQEFERRLAQYLEAESSGCSELF